MVNVSFAENKSSLESTDATTTSSAPGSGAVSIIALNFSLEHPRSPSSSYFFSGTFPLIAAGGNSAFYAGGGMNFYFNSLSSKIKTNQDGTKMTINPTLRYYAGFHGNLGYLVYSTETQRKSDMLFELGGQGGMLYNIKPKWSIKGEVDVSKGTGVATSTTAIKLMAAGTYDLND